jgi:hypothetical protein
MTVCLDCNVLIGCEIFSEAKLGQKFEVLATEYTELQPLLSDVHSVMRVKLALAGEGGGCTPTPFYYIYHHQ